MEKLYAAIRKGDLARVKACLDDVGDKINNPVGRYEYSPLTLACMKEEPQIVKLMMARNACVNQKDGNGKAAVFYAVASQTSCCLRALMLNESLDVNSRDANMSTPLHVACDNKLCSEQLQMLLRHPDISVDVVDGSGRSPKIPKRISHKERHCDENYDPNGNGAFENTTSLVQVRQQIGCVENDLHTLLREMDKKTEMMNKLKLDIEKLRIDKPNLQAKLNALCRQEQDLFEVQNSEKKKRRQHKQSSKRRKVSDSSVECPICFDEMCRPKQIFQCFQGHVFCSKCSGMITQCPICREELPPNPIRCLVLEQFINS